MLDSNVDPDARTIGAQLRQNQMFSALDDATLQALESRLEAVRLAANDTLFKQDEPGESLYLLTAGKLGVSIQHDDGTTTEVDQLGPGAVVGEMALLTRQPRTATVVALEESELVRLGKNEFERLAAAHPSLLDALAATLPRLHRTQLAGILRAWFGEMDTAGLHRLQEQVGWQHLTNGEPLFRQGDPGNELFLVVNGRLQIVHTSAEGEERILGEVSRGESVGEFSVLTGEPRTATVYAVRDTDVIRVPAELVEHSPRMLRQLSRTIVQRTTESLHANALDSRTAVTYTILPLGRQVPVEPFARRFARTLEPFGSTLLLDREDFDRAYGLEGASTIEHTQPLNILLRGWLNQQEATHRFIVYQADHEWTPWTQRCLRQADRILLLADATDDPTPGELEAALQGMGLRTPVELVLIQPATIDRPRGTMRWLAPRDVTAHHHLRLTNEEDYGRAARRLTGRAVGVVMSGGGAKGYVHIGLLRAMRELGIPIDMVGGTSMGAMIAGTYCVDEKYESVYQHAIRLGNPKLLVDYTFPYVALTKSKGVTKVYQSLFQDIQIEDLWLPYFCISANLSREEAVIHKRGSLWQAVRASTAIPGIFTPMLVEGEVLVDGGVMNNFPVDIMYEELKGGLLIGSNAHPATSKAKVYDFQPAISGWRVLLNRLLPWGKPINAPSIFSTLMRATSLNSKHLMRSVSELADVLIFYPVGGVGTLEFDRHAELVELGYQYSMEALQAWQATANGKHC